MQKRQLGAVGPVSRLVLGGGGFGGVWGETSADEARATIHAALDAGIDMLDAAPIYEDCERLIGETLEGKWPQGLKVTTKCIVGTRRPEQVYPRLRDVLEKSLATMRAEKADIFFLHNEICDDDYVYRDDNENRADFATPYSLYREAVVPALELLVKDGLAVHWGITGTAIGDTILKAIGEAPKPAVIQAMANLLDSPGNMLHRGAPQRHREIIAGASAAGIGVMGIRAVQAGALTAAFDRPVDPDSPDGIDYRHAAPFRQLCAQWGEDPAGIAHRYALSMPGIDTLVLGIKNRDELRQTLAAQSAGPLDPDQIAAIDALGLSAP